MDPTPSDKRELAIPGQDSAGGSLHATPASLLDNALKTTDPETIKRLKEVAATEAIKLEVQKREAAIHDENTQNKLDQTVGAARQLASTGQDFTIESEVRSRGGYTRVKVQNKEEPKREVKGSCFVASACFGDPDHPTVIQLRQFRDAVLSRHDWGRRFIEWYYANGPGIASFVERKALLKPPLRFSLRLFSWCFTSPDAAERR